VFSSDTTASGTIRAVVNVPGCQGQAETSWTARKTVSTGVQARDEVPRKFSLSQNYPNPFNPSTTIKYSLAKLEQVVLKVFNALGHEVTTLVNGKQSAGEYEVNWQPTNLPSGVYIYRLQAGEFVDAKKLILMR
jgi:hypothetical protein